MGVATVKDLFIGVDPGKSGAMCSLNEKGDYVSDIRHDNTTDYELAAWLLAHKDRIRMVVIEKVHAFPGQGSVSMFSFGESYGKSQGFLMALGIPFEYCTPQSWQRALSVKKKKKGESQNKFKNRLKQNAQRLFPNEKIVLANADSFLIAEYCRRVHSKFFGQ